MLVLYVRSYEVRLCMIAMNTDVWLDAGLCMIYAQACMCMLILELGYMFVSDIGSFNVRTHIIVINVYVDVDIALLEKYVHRR